MEIDFGSVNTAQVISNGLVFFALLLIGALFLDRLVQQRFETIRRGAPATEDILRAQIIEERERQRMRDEAEFYRRELRALIEDMLSMVVLCRTHLGDGIDVSAAEQRLNRLDQELSEPHDPQAN